MVSSDLRQSGSMFQRNEKFKLNSILLSRSCVPLNSILLSRGFVPLKSILLSRGCVPLNSILLSHGFDGFVPLNSILLSRGCVPFHHVDGYWILRDLLAPCLCFLSGKNGFKYSSILENFKPLQRSNTFVVN